MCCVIFTLLQWKGRCRKTRFHCICSAKFVLLPHLKRKHQKRPLPLTIQTNIMVNKTFPITADIRSIMIRVSWQNRQNIKFTFPKEIETTMFFFIIRFLLLYSIFCKFNQADSLDLMFQSFGNWKWCLKMFWAAALKSPLRFRLTSYGICISVRLSVWLFTSPEHRHIHSGLSQAGSRPLWIQQSDGFSY